MDEIYNQDHRLLHNLLQNADDAKYPRGVEPWVKFTLREGELWIDTNEKGFHIENVKSICLVHASSKEKERGSTGEKGIGFKSVFSVADRVHIQSLCWCFRFDYDAKDPISMITPRNEPFPRTDLPKGVTTRIRLSLREAEIGSLRKRLRDLPATHLMFLKRIVHVSFIEDDALFSMSPTRSIDIATTPDLHSDLKPDGPHSTIQLSSTAGGNTTSTCYKVWKTRVSVPFEEPKRGGIRNTVLSLAVRWCPVSNVPKPCNAPEHIFATLPMRAVQGLTVSTFTMLGLKIATNAGPRVCHPSRLPHAVEQGISHGLGVEPKHFEQDTDGFRHHLALLWLRP